MRTFADADGSRWSVTIGRESWGSFVLLFTPVTGGATTKAMIAGETALDAERALEGLTEAELRARLAESVPWTDDLYSGG
jgi:hypothetical protein